MGTCILKLRDNEVPAVLTMTKPFGKAVISDRPRQVGSDVRFMCTPPVMFDSILHKSYKKSSVNAIILK